MFYWWHPALCGHTYCIVWHRQFFLWKFLKAITKACQAVDYETYSFHKAIVSKTWGLSFITLNCSLYWYWLEGMDQLDVPLISSFQQAIWARQEIQNMLIKEMCRQCWADSRRDTILQLRYYLVWRCDWRRLDYCEMLWICHISDTTMVQY